MADATTLVDSMTGLLSHIPARRAAGSLLSAFLGVLFLQSSIDKIVDRKGNLDYLTRHFARSPLASTVRPMFASITVMEFLAGALSAVGAAWLALTGSATIAYAGSLIAGVAITALFFGQRVAKDYPGAAVLVPYFLLCLAGILLHGSP